MSENKITLTDLFDVDMLQRIQDAFSNMTGLASIITDEEGKPVTRGANFTDFCMKYTRNSPVGCVRCQQCDKHGAELALKVGSSVTYYCHAGLMDFAAPIMAGDTMIGCFVGGQVLTDSPDITRIMQVASELEINLIDYLQAVMKVRVLDKKKIDNDAYFLYTLTDTLSSIAYHKYRMEEANIEIEKAANMKSDFLANMSHELRTPMNAVIGMAEMALRRDMSPEVRSYLNQIRASGKTLLTIINDILDFSKIESGKMDIIEAEFEPTTLMYDIASIIVTRIDVDDVELVLDINPKIPRMLYGDNNRIKQVIINLANNAAKFTRKGKVELKFDYEKIDDKTINLLFAVEDTGIGIKQQDIKKIFQSFQQVDSKRNRNIEGTGLGLTICKQLLALMKGELSVVSEYGKGSCFSFNIPLKVVDASPSITINEEPAPAFGFLINEYSNKRMIKDMDNLGISFTNLSNISDVDALREAILPYIDKKPYLFVGQKLVYKGMLDFIKEYPDINGVIITAPGEAVDYGISNIKNVKKPISAMLIAAVYNNEEYTENQTNDDYYDFTAEDAEVLIVDDNIVNITVAEGLLEPLNMKIDTAVSGQEAIEKISHKMYDLILMDHMMPDMDGIETTHVIRNSHREYDKVPILALTANAVGDAKQMFIKEGMNDFIAKPIEVRVLVNKIHQWLPKSKISKTRKKHSEEKINIHLPQIEGINMEAAVKLVGNEKILWSIMKDYCRIIPQKTALIRKCIEEEDWKGYTVEVHAMKSSSRQIGAGRLSEKAALLEKAGNELDIDTILSKTEEALEEYQHYYDVLHPYFVEEHAVEATKELTDDILKEIFKEMERAIDELDIDLLEATVHKLDTYKLDTTCKMFHEKMCEAVENMDSYACEDIMKEWQGILKN